MKSITSSFLFRSFLAFLAVFVLLTLFVACKGTDGSQGTTAPNGTEILHPQSTVGDPNNSQDPTEAPISPTQTEFETFAKFEKNIVFFMHQAPFTFTTKGYYVEGIGGATYTLTKEKPAEKGYLQLSETLYVIPQVTDGMTEISPAVFGACGNGIADDTKALQTAADFASEHGLSLMLSGNYYTLSSWKLENLSVYASNARISYYGQELNRPAIDMFDNVNIYGTIHVYADIYQPPKTHGNRCGMAIGNYESGRGAKNCYVEHIVIWSAGMAGGNGILLTGDSQNITIDKITVPEGHNKVNVPLMMHWGNYGQHHPADLASPGTPYVHEEGYSPTTHPHDIKIGLIESYSNHSPFYISACYNVTVEKAIQYGGERGTTIASGDCGFKYATEEQRAHGAKNIRVGSLTATNITKVGIYFSSVGGSYESGIDVKIQATFDTVYLTSQSAGNGIAFYGAEDVSFGSLTLKGFQEAAVMLGYHLKSLQIKELTLDNCQREAIATATNLTHTGKDQITETFDVCKNLRINKMTVKNCGGASEALFDLRHVDGMKIEQMQIQKPNSTYLFNLYGGTKNVTVDHITLTLDSKTPSAILYAKQNVPAENHISITISGADNIPNTKGSTCGATLTKH